MRIEKYIPVATLQPFIKSFMIIESDYAVQNQILPDTAVVMAFRLRGTVMEKDQGILPATVLGGLRKSYRSLAYAANTANLLIVFREDGAAAFFKEPLHELFGASASLDNFIRRQQLDDITEQLASAPDNQACIDIIQRFLLTAWKQAKPDLLVQEALRSIRQANGNLRIKELLQELHISQDAFEKRFRKITGASPKQFASIVRLRSLIGRADGSTFTELAYEAGYFDQAHFIKDFKSFTGKTPGEFYRSALYW
ncbi:helix-turn-helix transcriptional regulator [Chitinophaga filiformis]|uniref:helix-turn-helix transcriptional regulator n=1 Tax=Chitinophaga filiformis TaxID=104663 RepID=UPI001F3EF8FD|nr:helix-turn-helix transcriptional regulator [Chitinophaga filiformis]MCF6406918.1 helix-turn-helix transcriptional regulator [Chitinophaga filiformis]